MPRVTIDSFHSAQNQVSQPFTKGQQFGDTGRNCIVSSRNAVETRPGSAKINSVAYDSGAEIRSIYDFSRHEGARLHCYLFNTAERLYQFHLPSGKEGIIKRGIKGPTNECCYVTARQTCYIGTGRDMFKYYALSSYAVGGETLHKIGTGQTTTRMAQSFTNPHGRNRTIVCVMLPLTKDPSPIPLTTNLYVELYTDSSGPGSLVATSQSIVANSISHAVDWVPFFFNNEPGSPPPVISANTKYWIVLRSSAAIDTTLINWALDPTDPEYEEGNFAYYDGSWNQVTSTVGLFAVFHEPEKWGMAPPSTRPSITALSASSMASYATGADTDKKLDNATISQLSQSFQSSDSKTLNLTAVDLSLKKVGAPAGNIYVEIQTNAINDEPSGSIIGTSELVDVTGLGTSYPASFPTNYVRFEFPDAVAIAPDTSYWIVVRGNDTFDANEATDYVLWQADDGGGYADGAHMYYSIANATWTTSASDCYFRALTGQRWREGGCSYKASFKNSLTGHISNPTSGTPYTGNSAGSVPRLSFATLWAQATVDQQCDSGTSVLYVDTTLDFAVGDEIVIGRGTAREESNKILNISTNNYLQLAAPLLYTHTVAQLDDVEALDPQADKIILWRTTDGGSIYWYLDELDIDTATYDDDASDDELDFTSEAPVDNFPPPAGFLSLRVRSSILIAGVANNPRFVFFSSGLGQTLEGVPEESFPAFNYQAIPSGSERVYAMAQMDDFPLVYTPDGMFIIGGQDPTTFQIYQARGGHTIGCMSKNGVAGTMHGMMSFSTDKKVYLMPTVSHIPALMSEVVEDAFEGIASDRSVERVLLENVRAAVLNWENLHCFILAVPTGESTVNNEVWIYDLDLHIQHTGLGWTGPHVLASGAPIQSMAVVTAPDEAKKLLVGDNAGFIREFLTGGRTTDDGQSFPAFYAFPSLDFQAPELVKDLLTVEVVVPATVTASGRNAYADALAGQKQVRVYEGAVAVDSPSGQPYVYCRTWNRFKIGQQIILNRGGAREEIGTIVDMHEQSYLKLAANLTYTHTAADADRVSAYFQVGETVVISRGNPNEEYGVIASATAYVINLVDNLVYDHLITNLEWVEQLGVQSIPSNFLQLSYDSENHWENIALTRVREMARGNSYHRYRGYLMRHAVRVKPRVRFDENYLRSELLQLTLDYQPMFRMEGLIHSA